MKKQTFTMNKTNISTSLRRLELHPTEDGKIKVLEKIEDCIFKDVSVEFILIIYGVMTLEITCKAAFFLDSVNILIILYEKGAQIIKLDENGYFKHSKLIRICFDSYDSYSVLNDTLIFTRNSEVVLFNKIQIK